nr:retrovirus-related Pol polyprotein from transposon TNT 1-94 [Tanacetum cinerariifolium]
MRANDKFGLGYGDYRYGSILSYENKILQSVFMNKVSNLEDTSVNDRYADGMHAIPSLMTGNYMPSKPDVEIDYSKFTYGPKQTSVDESDSKSSEYASCESDSRVEITTSMPAPVENAPKVVCEPKVWIDAPIIEEYESDSDNDSVSNVQKDKEKPSFAFTDSVKHVKPSRENVKETGAPNHGPKIKKHDRNDKQAELIKSKNKVTGQRVNRPVWNNVQRVNHQNKLEGIKREYSNARNPQQNRVAERKNRTLIEAAKTMVLVTKPQNKTPYELLTGKQPIISYLRPFGCYVTILNTIDQLGKFDGKSDLGFLVGYSLNNKAFKVNNLETKRDDENLHVNFLENKPNVAGKGHAWIFNLDYLTNFMNYKLVLVENQANKFAGPKEANNSAGTQANDDQSANSKEIDLHEEHFVLPIWSAYTTTVKSSREKIKKNTDFKTCEKPDIYASPSEEIFTDSSYDDEGVTRSKVNKNSEAHALMKVRLMLCKRNCCSSTFKRIEAIRIFLAFASYMGFIVYQMDIKSAFLYGTIDEEVYVSQPPGFVDLKFLNKVYKVVKSLYGLHQAPRAWYATSSTLLEKSRYRRGTINKTLFIKHDKKDIMLVQVYVDDIIFGSTKKSWCDEFEELMKNSVKTASTPIETQKPLVKDEEAADVDTASTPIETQKPLVKDEEAADVDVHLYRFNFLVVNIRLLNLLLHWLRELKVNAASLTLTTAKVSAPETKSTESEGFEQIIDFLNVSSVSYALTASPTICTTCIKQFWTTKKVKTINNEVRIQALIDEKKVNIKESSIRHTLKLDNAEEKGILIKVPKPLKGKAQIEQDEEFARQLKAKLNTDINWNAVMEQVTRSERLNDAVMKYQALKRKSLTEAQARKNMIIYLKNMAGFKMNYFKGMTYSEIRPLFEKHFNYNQSFLEEVNKEVTLPVKEVEVEAHKRECENLKKKVTKNQKMNEEAGDLKSHLQIVANDDDDDDVYTEATPLASKMPIVDYKIHFERNKPYFKIIRADGNHMLFLSFGTLLKNFNREDLETLWKLVKKRYGLAKVKSWKLFESVGVHCITFSTTQMVLLVEKRYSLTHFTLEQMLNNVRLEVEEVSEMSLELLRLVRRQLIEGYVSA